MTLRTYFSVLFAVLIMGASVLLSSSIGARSTAAVKTEIGESLGRTSFEMADKLDHYMWSRASEIDLLSQLGVIQNQNDPKEIQRFLNELQKRIPAFTWVGVTDSEGTVQAATRGILTGTSLSERPVYQEAVSGPFIGDVHEAVLLAKLLPNPSGEPLQFVDISVPIKDENGTFRGVLASHLSWAWAKEVEESLSSTLQANQKEKTVFIVSSRDNTVILGPEEFLGRQLDLQSLKKAPKNKSGWTLEKWPDGKRYVTGYAFGDGYKEYEGLEWTVLVRESEQSAFAPAASLQRSVLLAGALCALLFAALGWLLAGIIARPLRNMARAADQLLAGKRPELPANSGIKEVDSLFASFGNLLQSLGKTESALGHMQVLAHHDLLTGLPNRTGLDLYLRQIAENAPGKARAYLFMYADLDGFKLVNDRLGHEAGDVLLQQAAQRLAGQMPEGVFVCRLGGDEFLIVLESRLEEAADASKEIGARVVALLRQPFFLKQERVQIGCSVGGAIWPMHGQDFFDVIRLADDALYESKRNGKNQFSLWDEQTHLFNEKTPV